MISWLGGAVKTMKASKFSDAQKGFTLKQGADGIPVAWRSSSGSGDQLGELLQLEKKYDGLLPTEMKRLKQLEDGRR